MSARVPETKASTKSFALGAALIFFLTLIVYLPALNGEFLWDDDVLIYNNDLIRRGDGLPLIWKGFQTPDYFPLTLTSLWFEWRLWGAHTTGYHAGNIFLHALGAVLLWRVLQRLKIPGAFVGAAIFAVHPLCVASVAWIAERKNTLSLVFFLASLFCYLRWQETEAEEKRRRGEEESSSPRRFSLSSLQFYFASLVAFLLALLSKTSVVMLPFVLLLCDWWLSLEKEQGRKDVKGQVSISPFPLFSFSRLLRVAPFFALSLALGLVTVWFQSHRAIGYKSDPPLVRMAGGGWAVWFYLFKTILPMKLAMIYPRWEIKTGSPIIWLPWLAWFGALFALWKIRRPWSRPLFFALAYFFIMLLPVLGFFDMSFFAYARAADHLVYLSIIGIAALSGAFLTQLFTKQKSGPSISPGFKPAAALIIGGLCVLSWNRAQVFASSERLWSDTLKKNPKAWVAYNNLGEAIVARGDIPRAMECFESALQLKPDYPEANNNLGSAYSDLQRYPESFPYFQKALEARPDYAEAENNWGLALARSKQVDEAIVHFQNALRIEPNFSHAHYNLALSLVQKGRLGEAEEQYRTTLQRDPDYVDAHLNLAMVLADQKKFDEAEAEYNVTIRLAPELAEAYNGLGVLMIDRKKTEEAVHYFREASRLDPDNISFQRNLERALDRMAAGR